jgi:hypothetical protein
MRLPGGTDAVLDGVAAGLPARLPSVAAPLLYLARAYARPPHSLPAVDVVPLPAPRAVVSPSPASAPARAPATRRPIVRLAGQSGKGRKKLLKIIFNRNVEFDQNFYVKYWCNRFGEMLDATFSLNNVGSNSFLINVGSTFYGR